MDIDPRLRNLSSADRTSEPHQRPLSYSSSSLPQPSTSNQNNSEPSRSASLAGAQNHSYYSTPQSYYPSAHTSVNSAAPQFHEGDGGNGDPSIDPDASNPDPNIDPNSTQRSRACEACRSLKVRCEPDPANPEGSCKRCAKALRQCVVTVPNRKRQKKTDSRVAELEKKIDALTASLHASRGPPLGERHTPSVEQSPSVYPPPPETAHSNDDGSRDGWLGHAPAGAGGILQGIPTPPAVSGPKRKRSDEMGRYLYPLQGGSLNTSPPGAQSTNAGRQQSSTPAARDASNDFVDVIDRQIIDLESAAKIFRRYEVEMAPLMPVVVFPPETSVFEFRREKPILFLAILCVACGTIRPVLQPVLIDECHRLFAERVMVKGEKSLELVQALLVSTTWYQPPEQFEELKFYQFIHIAATMGIDIGMGKRTKPAEKKFMGLWKDNPWKKSNVPNPDALETRRTWLGCYFLCANAAMTLRRPILVRWQPYMEECIEILEKSPSAPASDKYLCQWVKLQHIAEEVAFQFSFDDPTGVVAVSDAKTQYALKGFERQLEDWRKALPEEHYTQPLMLSDYVVNLFVHEIAMHTDQNGEDFKPPYTEKMAGVGDSAQPDLITPAQIGALTNCLTSIHNIFNTFLRFDVDLLRSLPTIHLVRVTYTGVALIKLYSSVTVPGSKLGKVINHEDLKVEYYLESVLEHLGRAAEGNKSRPAAKFLQILGMLKSWYQKRKDGKAGKETSTGNFVGMQGALPPLTSPEGTSSQWSALTPPEGGKNKDNPRNTPLHLLSAVAMGDPSGAVVGSEGNGGLYKTPQVAYGMEGNMMEQMGFGGGDLDQAMGLGFGADDLSTLFMEDPFLNLGFPSADSASQSYFANPNY